MTPKTTCDVFISHAPADTEIANKVALGLHSAGWVVFHAGAMVQGTDISKAIWEALAESRVLVTIVSPDCPTHAMGLVEIGAASAWSKPIFVLLNGPSTTRLPAAVTEYPVYPLARLDDLIHAIGQSFEPLSEEDRRTLASLYKIMNVPADRLTQSPKALRTMTDRFNRQTQRHLSGERILSEILRMRKQGKLPRLQASPVKASSLLKRNRLRPPKVKPSPFLKRYRAGTRKSGAD